MDAADQDLRGLSAAMKASYDLCCGWSGRLQVTVNRTNNYRPGVLAPRSPFLGGRRG